MSWGPLKIKKVIFQEAVYICANTKRKDEGSAREEDVTKKWKWIICKTKRNVSSTERKRSKYDGQLEVYNERPGAKR